MLSCPCGGMSAPCLTWSRPGSSVPSQHSSRFSYIREGFKNAASPHRLSGCGIAAKQKARELACAARQDEREDSPGPESSSDPSDRQRKKARQLEDEQSIAQAVGQQLRQRRPLRRVVSSLTLYAHTCHPHSTCVTAWPLFFVTFLGGWGCQVAGPDRHCSIGAGAFPAHGPVRTLPLGQGRHAPGHSMLLASSGVRYDFSAVLPHTLGCMTLSCGQNTEISPSLTDAIITLANLQDKGDVRRMQRRSSMLKASLERATKAGKLNDAGVKVITVTEAAPESRGGLLYCTHVLRLSEGSQLPHPGTLALDRRQRAGRCRGG